MLRTSCHLGRLECPPFPDFNTFQFLKISFICLQNAAKVSTTAYVKFPTLMNLFSVLAPTTLPSSESSRAEKKAVKCLLKDSPILHDRRKVKESPASKNGLCHHGS